MGLGGFFKRLARAVGITALFVFTAGIGGIGGAGFIGAIRALGTRAVAAFFATQVVLGEIAAALTPRLRQPQTALPIFSGAARGQRLYGRKEVSGIINEINESGSGWLSVTYTIAQPCEVMMGLRIMGIYSEFAKDVSLLEKTDEYQTLKHTDYANRIRVYWNLTGVHDPDVGNAAAISGDKKGYGVSWVTVWIKRDKFFTERGFTLDSIKFKVARTRKAYEEDGENPADAILHHMLTYCKFTMDEINMDSVDRARDICDTVAGGNKIRVNGVWRAGTEYTVLQQLIASMDGNLMQIADQYHLFANPLSTDPPATVIIEENKLLDSALSAPLPEWDSQYNQCQATYADDSQGTVLSTPIYSFPGLIEDDGGEFTYDAGHFQFLERPDEVKRVIVQKLYRFRFNTKVQVTLLEGDYNVKVWDKVRLNMPSVGLADNGDEYRIIGIASRLSGQIDVLLQKEFNEGWYPALYNSSDLFSPNIRKTVPDVRTAPKPPAPRSFRLTGSGQNTLTFSWNTVPGAEGYLVVIYESGKWIKQKSFTGTSGTITGLTPGTQYTATLQAFNPILSVVVEITVSTVSLPSLPSPPTKVTGVTVSRVTAKGFRATWNKSNRATSYDLWLYDPDDLTSPIRSQWASTITTESFSYAFLDSNTSYLIRIRGRNAGGPGPWSDDEIFKTLRSITKPGPPSITTLTNRGRDGFGGRTVSVRFTAPQNADNVILEVNKVGASAVRKFTIFAQLQVKRVHGLEQGVDYRFRMQSMNTAGSSSWTRWQTITVT